MLCCLALVAGTVLAGCSDPVSFDGAADDLGSDDRAACAAFLDDLPDELADEERRDLEPAGAPGAAYGDPPIVLRCVDRAPAEVDATAQCQQVNDVGWFVPDAQVADDDADAVLTGLSHRPFVEVTVPADYRPEGAAAVLAELSAPISDNLEQVDDCL